MHTDPRIRWALDASTAVGFLVIGWASSAAPTQTDPFFRFVPRDETFVVLLVLATLPYFVRRRWATAVFLLSLLATTTLWLLGYNPGALALVLLAGAYFVASARPTREVGACAAAAASCFALLWWGGGTPYDEREAIASVLAFGATLALGRTGRLRVELAEARAVAVEEAALRRSSDERLHVSRELHDIVGHTLGIIAVQAGVGRHLMESEPQRAAEALDNIARISRDSLGEVRSVLASLRDGEPGFGSAPGLADVANLVESTRLTGLAVELNLPEDLLGVPRPAAAAVYRITREALSNVIRHADASVATVRVVFRDGSVELSVRDDGRRAARGHATPEGDGVTGMRERAEAVGGTLTAGATAEGGFLVSAYIPAGKENR